MKRVILLLLIASMTGFLLANEIEQMDTSEILMESLITVNLLKSDLITSEESRIIAEQELISSREEIKSLKDTSASREILITSITNDMNGYKISYENSQLELQAEKELNKNLTITLGISGAVILAMGGIIYGISR